MSDGNQNRIPQSPCPSENTLSDLQAGLLGSVRVEAIHHHFDECSSCLELAGALGCLNTDGRESKAISPPAANRDRFAWFRVLSALLLTVIAQLYVCLAVASPIARIWAGSFSHSGFNPEALSSPAVGVVLYLACSGMSGLLANLAAMAGYVAKRRWSKVALRIGAALAVATIVLAPLGLCLALSMRGESTHV